MTCPLTQLVHSQNSRLTHQIQTLQEDLQNLSRLTSHLSNLTDEEIQAFDFSGQLETIHQCLRRFEARLLSINPTAYKYEFAVVESSEPTTDSLPDAASWQTIHQDARAVKILAVRLDTVTNKIRASLVDLQATNALPKNVA